MSIGDVQQIRRLRGVILELIYSRHRAQQSRMDHIALWHMVRDLQHDSGINDVLTALQDLEEREMVSFVQYKDRFTAETKIKEIQILPKGRDLVEAAARGEEASDAAILL